MLGRVVGPFLSRLVVARAETWKATGTIRRSVVTGICHQANKPSQSQQQRSSHQGVMIATDFMMQQQREKDALPTPPASSSASPATTTTTTTTRSASSSHDSSSNFNNMARRYCIDTGVFVMEDNIAMEECVARNLARLQQGNVVPVTRMEKILEGIISANSSSSSSLPLRLQQQQHVA
jgi:hypothetical protein